MKDLTVGDTGKCLRGFAIPMFVSVVFQQMYNIADSVIAGKWAGKSALAAVGASYPITMIFLAIAVGANIGSSVIISQLFGHKEYGRMKTAIFTSIISVTILAALLTVAGEIGSNTLMQQLHTPETIFEDSALYLRVYIWGLTFLFLYNISTGVFTALGDSKTPLWFLIGSSVGNIILDLIFVICLKMGVSGVAWATFITQGIASLLALATLLFRLAKITVAGSYKKFSLKMLGRISAVAVPSILQQSFVSVGNLFIQSLVNGFGDDAIAGYSAAIKLNTFTITSLSTVGNALSSFSAQNIGAGKISRVKEGVKCGIKMGVSIAAAFVFLYFVCSKYMIGLFVESGEEQVIYEGVRFLRIVSPFYPVVCIKLLCDGVLRGGTAMKSFMATTFLDLILRVVLAYILVRPLGIMGIWSSWPIGWGLSAVLSVWFYKRGNWKPAD